MTIEPYQSEYGYRPISTEPTRRKVFISYSHLDQAEVDTFIHVFGDVFIARMLRINNQDDFIQSTNTAYVMQRIRQKYIQDASVTIVLVGACTHSRRYVDWEIKASLQQAADGLPNGLMAIQLLSCPNGADLPPRFADNWKLGNRGCYAKYWKYPDSSHELRKLIEDAFYARTSLANLIVNSQEMMKYNGVCHVHKRTH